MFAEWPAVLAPAIEVVPALLPGRGARFNDEPYREFDAVLTDLTRAILPWLDRDFVLFGHSLGALLAYELAARLQEQCGRCPRHLFLAGTRAPHCARPDSALLRPDDHELDDATFACKLASLGGIPREYVADPELLSVLLPTVRADFQIYDSYLRRAPPSRPPLSCPITALGGLEDVAEIPEQSLREWRQYTNAEFRLHMFLGDHFFVLHRGAEIARRVRDAVTAK